MISVGKSKISRHKPKKDIIYPLVRLPQSCAEFIGETAYIHKTECEGKTLFVLSFDENFEGELQVVQPSSNSELESRVKMLEKELKALQKTLSDSQRDVGGPDEIRTHDPRRVKAMS